MFHDHARRTASDDGQREAVAIDVRGSVPYDLGHIDGAVSMPLGLIAQRFDELPQDKLIVAYCSCKAEETSLEAAMLLSNQHGFARVAVLHGGYPAWKDAGLPVEVIRPWSSSREHARRSIGVARRAARSAGSRLLRSQSADVLRRQGRSRTNGSAARPCSSSTPARTPPSA